MAPRTDMDIDSLEKKLKEAKDETEALLRSGKIPTPADYAEVDRIKAELKVARRVRKMDEKRVDPKLTKQIGVRLTEDEYQELTKKAAETGVDLSTYIRNLLKI